MAIPDTVSVIMVTSPNEIKGPVNLSQNKSQKCDGKSTKVPHTFKSTTLIPNQTLTILSALVVTIVLMIMLTMIYLTLRTSTKCSQTVLDSVSNNSRKNALGREGLRIVPRDEWLARAAVGPLDKLNLPAHRVIIAHTATESCSSQSQCSYRTKIIQEFHIDSRGFDDIAYNFLVGGDGAIYEGRGWDFIGAHTKGYVNDSICFAFLGTFENEAPPENQLNATKLMIQEGLRLNKLVKDYKLYGARQLMMGSISPGLALYEIIKQWPNWSPVIV